MVAGYRDSLAIGRDRDRRQRRFAAVDRRMIGIKAVFVAKLIIDGTFGYPAADYVHLSSSKRFLRWLGHFGMSTSHRDLLNEIALLWFAADDRWLARFPAYKQRLHICHDIRAERLGGLMTAKAVLTEYRLDVPPVAHRGLCRFLRERRFVGRRDRSNQ